MRERPDKLSASMVVIATTDAGKTALVFDHG
jgi:hypothetical protein